MTIIELRAKRNKAWEAAKEFAETHRTPAGTLSAEDEATYNALEKQIMDYGREIQRMERQEAIDAELAKPVTAPITGRPGNLFDSDANMTRAEAAAILYRFTHQFPPID